MGKFFSLFIVSLQIASTAPYVEAHLLPQGCACHCDPDTATVRIWQQKDGQPDRFVARAMARWLNRIDTDIPTRAYARTELLILLGKSAKGVWSVETQKTDAGAEIYSNLVCTTVSGRRKVFPMVKGLFSVKPSLLASLVLRRLRQLARRGQWDTGSLTPVQLPLLSKPPALVLHEKGTNGYMGYVWRLNLRAKNGRIVQIARGSDSEPGFYRGAKCFGGVLDDANGETWWVLVKTAFIDNCSAEWRSIHLPYEVPAKQ
ncbi:MAG: hypothetical protein V7641_4619 [Blastocatellia bacterium]